MRNQAILIALPRPHDVGALFRAFVIAMVFALVATPSMTADNEGSPGQSTDEQKSDEATGGGFDADAELEKMLADLEKQVEVKAVELKREFEIVLKETKEKRHQEVQKKLQPIKEKEQSIRDEFQSMVDTHGGNVVENQFEIDCRDDECLERIDELNAEGAANREEFQKLRVEAADTSYREAIEAEYEGKRLQLEKWASEQEKQIKQRVARMKLGSDALQRPAMRDACLNGCRSLKVAEDLKACIACCWTSASVSCNRPALGEKKEVRQTLTPRQRQQQRIDDIFGRGYQRPGPRTFKVKPPPPPKFD